MTTRLWIRIKNHGRADSVLPWDDARKGSKQHISWPWQTKPNCRTRLCRSDALDPYRKFVAFYSRSENPFVNYYSVLDAGMAWETSQFGDLSRDESVFVLVCFSVLLLILPKISCRECSIVTCLPSASFWSPPIYARLLRATTSVRGTRSSTKTGLYPLSLSYFKGHLIIF